MTLVEIFTHQKDLINHTSSLRLDMRLKLAAARQGGFKRLDVLNAFITFYKYILIDEDSILNRVVPTKKHPATPAEEKPAPPTYEAGQKIQITAAETPSTSSDKKIERKTVDRWASVLSAIFREQINHLVKRNDENSLLNKSAPKNQIAISKSVYKLSIDEKLAKNHRAVEKFISNSKTAEKLNESNFETALKYLFYLLWIDPDNESTDEEKNKEIIRVIEKIPAYLKYFILPLFFLSAVGGYYAHHFIGDNSFIKEYADDVTTMYCMIMKNNSNLISETYDSIGQENLSLNSWFIDGDSLREIGSSTKILVIDSLNTFPNDTSSLIGRGVGKMIGYYTFDHRDGKEYHSPQYDTLIEQRIGLFREKSPRDNPKILTTCYIVDRDVDLGKVYCINLLRSEGYGFLEKIPVAKFVNSVAERMENLAKDKSVIEASNKTIAVQSLKNR